MYENIRLFRRRYIPEELKLLSDDEIVSVTDDRIVTRWKSIHPRYDFSFGESTYLLKKNLKISRIMDKDMKFLHWYVDIVRFMGREALMVPETTHLNTAAADYLSNRAPETDRVIVVEDLLLDVRVLPTGCIEIEDMDEAAEALKTGLISSDMLKLSMDICQNYVKMLYARFDSGAFTSEAFVMPE